MKSIALTLAVLLSTLVCAQADNTANQKAEEIVNEKAQTINNTNEGAAPEAPEAPEAAASEDEAKK